MAEKEMPHVQPQPWVSVGLNPTSSSGKPVQSFGEVNLQWERASGVPLQRAYP